MSWLENINFRIIGHKIKEYWKMICFISVIIGVISLAIDLIEIKRENDNKYLTFINWYDQLPEEHWLKRNNEYQMMMIQKCCENAASSFFKIAAVEIGQEGNVGKIFEKAIKKNDSYIKKKYCFKDSEGKVIKKLRLKVGEDYKVSFFYDETELLLDFSEEEYINEISNLETNSVSLANKIAFSCSDDPKIATIFDGHIVGISKGKTAIHLVCNGYFFSYDVTVE